MGITIPGLHMYDGPTSGFGHQHSPAPERQHPFDCSIFELYIHVSCIHRKIQRKGSILSLSHLSS